MEKKVVIYSIILFIVLLIFLKPYSKIRELNIKNRVLIEEIGHLKTVNERLVEEKRKLEKDPSFVEKRAREKMGVVKEGEIIYRFITEEE